MHGRVMALDFGDRRIGIALSDALGIAAGGLRVLERKSASADVEEIARLAGEHGVSCVVFGLPVTLKGTQRIQAQKVRSFATLLKRRIHVPIEFVDERFTTVQGERALRSGGATREVRKRVIDQVAAQLILQQFLGSREKGSAQ